MKAILCTDNSFGEIYNWYNFEECKKFIFNNITKRSTIIVDDKLFEALKKLGLTKDFNMIVFKSKKMFEDATNCKNFLELEKELKKLSRKKTKVYVTGGSKVFNELLPFCSGATVGRFNKKIKNLPISPEPREAGKWVKLHELEGKDVTSVIYANVMEFPLLAMQVKEQLEHEDKKNGNEPHTNQVNVTKTSVIKTTNTKPQNQNQQLINKVVKSKEIAEKAKSQRTKTHPKKQAEKASKIPDKQKLEAEMVMQRIKNKRPRKTAAKEPLQSTIFDFAEVKD